ncbi:MAG TPA: hypothetical protein EYN91_14535 [Candidatus Melainabacteria bacterium]|jgi:hypothetical protein|nr:hypothetical protein [Candidatus Melainabacteria bacterium]HIN67212.1 hypothetical protein [Candidatus Obscuribacterales bacterium]
MPSKEDSDRLLVKLTRIAAENDEREEARARERYTQLLNHIDVTPYKKTAAWPGKSYLLVGNSYNMDFSFQEPVERTRRATCIALLFRNGERDRNWIPLAEALQDVGFASVLSRFEREWLSRMPETAMIGPAYDNNGNLIARAFAVWRKESATEREREKQLVTAGSGKGRKK